MNQNIRQSIVSLFEKTYQVSPESITELPSSGSNRIYFRITAASNSIIAAYNKDKKENMAFISFSKQFSKLGLPVPQVLAEDLINDIYFLNDLGDKTLFSMIEDKRAVGFDETLVNYYKKAISSLLDFQTMPGSSFDYTVCYPRSAFDKQSMMWDLNYFKYYFLKLAGITFDEQKLEDDFHRFSDYLLQSPAEFFMYRDFQSRNIMLLNSELFFIDYQGGRKGPLEYDLASLLYDAKADLPDTLRKELLNFYIDELNKRMAVDHEKFTRSFYAFVLIRIMQAMGAYGFRGFYEKKTLFLRSIPYAVNNLRNIISEYEFPVDVPTLQQVLQQICNSPELQKYEFKKTDELCISIQSFSFKKSYPVDHSENGGGFVFDCRAVANPGRYESYKMLTGKDDAVIDFLNKSEDVQLFFETTKKLVVQSVENYLNRGFSSLAVNYGCTGGQHRSVYCAEKLAAFLQDNFPVKIQLQHRELV